MGRAPRAARLGLGRGAQHLAHRARGNAQRSASRGAVRRRHRDPSSSASSHVAGARDFMNVSTTRRPRQTIGVGT